MHLKRSDDGSKDWKDILLDIWMGDVDQLAEWTVNISYTSHVRVTM